MADRESTGTYQTVDEYNAAVMHRSKLMADDLIERLRKVEGFLAGDYAYSQANAVRDAADALASKDAAISERDVTIARQGAAIMEWSALVQKNASDAVKWQGRAEAAESQLEMARKALERAAIIIKEDRNTTFHCGTVRGDPATMDAPTREAIADYDAVLAEIARALAEGETK